MNEMTEAQKKEFTEFALGVAHAIRDAGELPRGHLYALLMNRLNFEQFQILVDIMIEVGLIRQKGYMLTYAGK